MQKDALLVKQTLAGEHEAFHRLIIFYQSDIYAFILSWVRNPDDAKELVQDVFLEAYRDLGSLRQHERFYFWLRQIARYHCQNWLKRKREFVPLSDDIVAKTPSADETLILRETLAKIMQAVDELPETEKQILKERYLDDSTYDELQAKHGLSYKALNMRLSRAKEKVRARVEKLLAGIGIFSWHDALRKMLSGGVEAMKIGAKVEIIAIGVGAVLVLGGAGVIVWHHQITQEEFATNINQTTQQINTVSLAKNTSVNKILPTKKPIDKPKEDARDDKTIERTISQEEEIAQEIKKPEPKTETKIETKKEDNVKSGLTPEQEQGRIDFVAARVKELPLLVEQWKELHARQAELSNRPEKSDADIQELKRFPDEQFRIESRIIEAAMSYHSLYPEEGAIFYPNGWIGRLVKPVMRFGEPDP